jgi:hypothetical protein
MTPAPFEGYTPYTTWTLRLPSAWTPKNKQRMSDVIVRIAYYYLNAQRPSTEAAFVSWMRAKQLGATPALNSDSAWVASQLPVRWYSLRLRSLNRAQVSAPELRLASAATLPQGVAAIADTPVTPAAIPGWQPCATAAGALNCPSKQTFKVEVVCRSRVEISKDLFEFHLAQSRRAGSPASTQQASTNAATDLKRLVSSQVCQCPEGGCAAKF